MCEKCKENEQLAQYWEQQHTNSEKIIKELRETLKFISNHAKEVLENTDR